MKKLGLIILGLITSLLLTGSTTYQTATEIDWEASYWNNTDLEGDPALVRDEDTIDYQWGLGTPAPSIDANTFSAQWQTTADLAPGIYEVEVTSDDGVRIYVDGDPLIDEWADQRLATYTALFAAEGETDVTVEYYEDTGAAAIQVDWQIVTGADDDNWIGLYFDDTDLETDPVYTDTPDELDFTYEGSSPNADLLGETTWSARWVRTFDVEENSTYELSVTSDDGVRVYVNDDLIIDEFTDHPPRTYEADMFIDDDQAEIVVEYYQNLGDATLEFDWNIAEIPTEDDPIADTGLLLDNDDDNLLVGGIDWDVRRGGFDGTYRLSPNTNGQVWPYEYVRWYVNEFVEANDGRYTVWVYIPDTTNLTDSAKYWVHHTGGYEQITVDQNDNRGEWITLGTYTFGANNLREFVSLSDVTGEISGTTDVAFDAIQLVPAD